MKIISTKFNKLRPATNRADVDQAWTEGRVIYAASEMDGELSLVTDRAMLNSYTVDALAICQKST
jgi:hypothetical protein